MSETYTYGSQHGNPPPVADQSYLALWAKAEQERFDAEQRRLAEEAARKIANQA